MFGKKKISNSSDLKYLEARVKRLEESLFKLEWKQSNPPKYKEHQVVNGWTISSVELACFDRGMSGGISLYWQYSCFNCKSGEIRLHDETSIVTISPSNKKPAGML